MTAQLRLAANGSAALQMSAADITLPARVTLGGVRLRCGQVRMREPDWRCESGSVELQRSPLGPLQAGVRLQFDSSRSTAELALSGLALADGQLNLRLHSQGTHWQIETDPWQATLTALQPWLQRWWRPPAGWQLAGRLTARVQARGTDARLESGTLSSQWRELVVQNAASTIATERLSLDADATLGGTLADWQGELSLQGVGGQALAGPVLLDFAANPLQLHLQASGNATEAELRELRLDAGGLIGAEGSARIALAPTLQLHAGILRVAALRFPAAFTSFLQLPLATTDFGALQSQGEVRGRLEVRDDRLTTVELETDGLEFIDDAKGLALHGLQGAVHWRASGEPAPPASQLQWRSARAFGLASGATTLQLLAQAGDLQLTAPARVPLFDGALQVQRFEARRLGSDDVELDFDGRIDAIGMPEISRAFGWPAMAGTLSGRLPGLAYRGGTLSVAGDIVAQVFDGTITASGLQLRDAFGRFPRLRGTFAARRLDLEAITRTFPIGSITGRLDADVQGLELFGWSPVAFDAQLYTTPGDRTRHRISQKAVSSLANLGGGGGGVVAALQSGFLRFFDEFGYDRIGLRCQLRDDVCLMNGIARPEGGFYIVKGGGLPRLDVIGTSGRVAWTQLLTQVQAALAGGPLKVE